MLIQVHILQNYAPSNLNRDDNNRPKSALFGGVERGRVSSQSLKRAIRFAPLWRDAFVGLLAVRTIQLPAIVREEMEEMKVDKAKMEAILKRVPEIGKKDKDSPEDNQPQEGETENVPETIETSVAKKPATSRRGKKSQAKEGEEASSDDGTGQLIFIAPNERRNLAEALLQLYEKVGPGGWATVALNKELDAKGRGIRPYSPDVALFGRMTTSDAFLNVTAAAQIAHAISTNEMKIEADYFTGLDDRLNQARIIGDTEFNSGTYYKFVNVFWEGLVGNLAQAAKAQPEEIDVARRAVLKLVEGAIKIHPTGKLNPFANHQLPDFVLVEVRRENLPLSYANAFLKPVRFAEGHDFMDDSVEHLKDYMARMSKMYSFLDQRAFTTSLANCAVPGAERKETVDDLLAWLDTQLPKE